MKKYFFILLVLSVFLSACQRNDYVELDFDSTSAKFSQQVEDIIQNIQKLGFFGQVHTEIQVDLKGENKDFDFKSKIDLTGDVDFIAKDKDLLLHTNSLFDDKKEKQITNISGFLQFLSAKKQNFLHLHDLHIDLGPANYQNNLFLLISKYLSDKRILVDINEKNLGKNIHNLLQNIIAINIFENIQDAKYNTKLAYKIEIKKDILNNINQNTGLQIEKFKGLFVVLSPEDIELKIEELAILFNGKHFSINGFVSKDSLDLAIRDPQKQNNINTYKAFSWNSTKNNHNISIKDVSNYQDNFVLKLNINNKTAKAGISNTVNGSIIFYSNFIYGTNIEKDIQININVKQNIFSQSGFYTEIPSSYIHLDQILGDDFSLKNILITETL